jgi:hypothetical protein
VTATLTVQVAPAASVPPLSPSVLPAAVAATTPPQLVVVAGVAATTTLAGNVSENVTLVSAIAPTAVFASVTVNVDVPPIAIGLGENAFVTVMLGAATVSVAVAGVALVAPCVVTSVLAGIVLT